MGTTRAVTGRGRGQNAAKVRERVEDGDKNIFCGAVMGSSSCPRVIFYFRQQVQYAYINFTSTIPPMLVKAEQNFVLFTNQNKHLHPPFLFYVYIFHISK